MSNPIEILGQLHREVSERHDIGYRAWLDKITTLSLAALTALVSLQSMYVPRSHRAIWLLCVVWGSLAVAVLAGLLALFGEARAHQIYRIRLREQILSTMQGLRASGAPDPTTAEFLQMLQKVPYNRPKLYLVAAAAAAGSLGAGVSVLAVFAALNLWP